jgi:hypothetical protein
MTAAGLTRRLAALETACGAGGPDCATCRHVVWGEVLGRPWPADNRCPTCGRALGTPRTLTLDIGATSVVDMSAVDWGTNG